MLTLALAVLAALMASPWGMLWLAVPLAAASSLALAWRFGVRAMALPVLLLAGAAVLAAGGVLWAAFVPAAALSGTWMGLREEGGGPNAGERAWMLVPALLLAAGLPFSTPYPGLVANVDREMQAGDRQLLEVLSATRTPANAGSLERQVRDNARLRTDALPAVLPVVLFAWVAVLVAAGRTLAAHVTAALGWPRLSRSPLRDWRLPDAALWVFLGGLALLLLAGETWAPTGWTLLLASGLGFCLQGIAVVESALLSRGVPMPMIVLTLLFVSFVAMPFFVVAAGAVGLSDAWLDYRKLEGVPDTDASPGDR